MCLAVRIAKKELFPDLAHCSVPSCRSVMSACAHVESACFITYLGTTPDCVRLQDAAGRGPCAAPKKHYEFAS